MVAFPAMATGRPATSRLLQLTLAFLVALAVIGLQMAYKGVRLPQADEIVYLDLATDLNNTGTFTDGIFADPGSGGRSVPGRFFAPAYPMILHALSRLDPAVQEFARCHSRRSDPAASPCRKTPFSLLALQAVMAALGMACIFAIALLLTDWPLVAGLSLALALATGEASYYARTCLTENAAFLAFYVFMAAAVAAAMMRRSWAFAVAGAALALAALSRPSYLYLLYAAVILLVFLAAMRLRNADISWRHLAAFALAAGAILAPWTIRNLMVFGDPALSKGYGGFILVQRIAYNAMTPTEWGVSLIAWLPDFGDQLARALFSPESYVRLGWKDPSAFYVVGNGQFLLETLKASGGRADHLSYLLHNHVLAAPFKHMAVTLPLTLRGIWVGNYLSLAAVMLAIPVGLRLMRAGRLAAYLVLALPPLFIAGLHGFTSVNVPRYNVPLIALYAFVVAFTIAGLLVRRQPS